ncbi:MAG: SUMF1/EgtB/PvdO family nonheme iron enzyme [Bacteroidota bacterium]
MHRLFLYLSLFFTSTLAANPALPPPFEGVLYALHEGSFYDQQAAAWEALATSECATDEHWWHYYKTAHYSNRFGSGSYDLAAILADAEKNCDPEGFDLNYLRFAHEQDPEKRYPFLLKAHAIDPDRLEASTGLSAYYAVKGLPEKRNELLRRMHAARALPASLLEYNYNQLQSVAKNGILLTHGDADTYPSWLLQSAYGVRPDVLVVNVSLLLGYEEYRAHIRNLLGVEELFASYPLDVAGLLEQLVEYERPVYYAATGEAQLTNLPKDRLYLAGLAFRYSKDPVNNLGELAKNYQNWRVEKLAEPFDDSPSQRVADALNTNYLPALLELYMTDKNAPGTRFAETLPLIRKLAMRAGILAEIETYLADNTIPVLASNNPGIKAKDILKNVVYIPPGTLQGQSGENEKTINGFFFQTTEVSNADYQLFLEDLLRQRHFAYIERAAVAEMDWVALLPAVADSIPSTELLAGGAPTFPLHPVVNISREAARLYARWLSEAYNKDPKRKGGRNVRFRLPLADEFAYAARGGKKQAPYPWGGPYHRNSKGCLLANFNTLLPASRQETVEWRERVMGSTSFSEKEKDKILTDRATKAGCEWESDGSYLTVKVDAYFPNDYGLYNMSGNAAEMTQTPDLTIGGSWLDGSYEMQIGVTVERKLPHPSTGFRLVMTYVD